MGLEPELHSGHRYEVRKNKSSDNLIVKVETILSSVYLLNWGKTTQWISKLDFHDQYIVIKMLKG